MDGNTDSKIQISKYFEIKFHWDSSFEDPQLFLVDNFSPAI